MKKEEVKKLIPPGLDEASCFDFYMVKEQILIPDLWVSLRHIWFRKSPRSQINKEKSHNLWANKALHNTYHVWCRGQILSPAMIQVTVNSQIHPTLTVQEILELIKNSVYCVQLHMLSAFDRYSSSNLMT